MGLERVKEKWLAAEACFCAPCKWTKVTHVVFLNTPDDEPYVVGACAGHVKETAFPYMPVKAFAKIIDHLLDKCGVEPADLPWAVWKKIETKGRHGPGRI